MSLRKSASGSRVEESWKSCPRPRGYQCSVFTPLGMYSTAIRTGGLAAADWASAEEGIIASSQGRPRLTPAPRSSVLRESPDLRVLTVSLLFAPRRAHSLFGAPDIETARLIRSTRSAS